MWSLAGSKHAGPFVSGTKLRLQDAADHSYIGNGNAASASFGGLMHHGDAIVIQGDSYRMRDKDLESTDE
jgi:hypothetical protein